MIIHIKEEEESMVAIPSRVWGRSGKEGPLDQTATCKDALRKSGRNKRFGLREQWHRNASEGKKGAKCQAEYSNIQ